MVALPLSATLCPGYRQTLQSRGGLCALRTRCTHRSRDSSLPAPVSPPQSCFPAQPACPQHQPPQTSGNTQKPKLRFREVICVAQWKGSQLFIVYLLIYTLPCYVFIYIYTYNIKMYILYVHAHIRKSECRENRGRKSQR